MQKKTHTDTRNAMKFYRSLGNNKSVEYSLLFQSEKKVEMKNENYGDNVHTQTLLHANNKFNVFLGATFVHSVEENGLFIHRLCCCRETMKRWHTKNSIRSQNQQLCGRQQRRLLAFKMRSIFFVCLVSSCAQICAEFWAKKRSLCLSRWKCRRKL